MFGCSRRQIFMRSPAGCFLCPHSTTCLTSIVVRHFLTFTGIVELLSALKKDLYVFDSYSWSFNSCGKQLSKKKTQISSKKWRNWKGRGIYTLGNSNEFITRTNPGKFVFVAAIVLLGLLEGCTLIDHLSIVVLWHKLWMLMEGCTWSELTVSIMPTTLLVLTSHVQEQGDSWW